MRFGRGLLVGLSLVAVVHPQSVITTAAGTDFVFQGDGRSAIEVPISAVFGIAISPAGELLVASQTQNLLLRVQSNGILRLVAGNGFKGLSGDGQAATGASLSSPLGIVADSSGNIYFSDQDNQRVRRIRPSGIIETVAGILSASNLGDSGPAVRSSLSYPIGLALDSAGNLFIADAGHDRIRMVSPDGVIRTVAGNGQRGYSGDGQRALDASLNNPQMIAIDASGVLYIADAGNHRVRTVSPGGVINTIAGTGDASFSGDGGPARNAALNSPVGVATDRNGVVYIADSNNHRIRRIENSIIRTIAGTGIGAFSGDGGSAAAASLNRPAALAFDSQGNLFVADFLNYRVRRVDVDGKISTLAGSGGSRFSGDGGLGRFASLDSPQGVSLGNDGTILVADTVNERIRRISAGGVISTIAGNGNAGFCGDGGAASEACLNVPLGSLATDAAGNIYFADRGNHRIRRVSPDGVITTVAGNGTLAFSGDGAAAKQASLDTPTDVAVDGSGNLYIADYGNHRIRKVSANGVISTVAGNGGAAFGGDGAAATAASLNHPYGVAVDSAGNLYIADYDNARVRKVSGGIIRTIAGNGISELADAGPALSTSIFGPLRLALDSTGGVYIAEFFANRILYLSPDGMISPVVGNGSAAFEGDGGAPLTAALNLPTAAAVDASGNLFIADSGNNRIRKVLSASSSFQTSQTRLNFAAPAGASPPAAETIALAPSVRGLPYTTSSSATWLSITPIIGAMPASLRVVADPSQLTAGNYSATIAITAPDAKPSTATISVSFSVSPALSGKLALGSTSLSFSFTQGASPDSKQLTISNQGSGSIGFTASATTATGGNWLAVSPNSGNVTPLSAASVAVTVNPGSLAAGSYSGTIAITTDTGQTPIAIPVTLAISAPPQKIRLSQDGFTFTAVEQGGSVLPQSLGVLNAGAGTLNFSVQATSLAGTAKWLNVSTNSGTVIRPFQDVSFISVSVDARSLAPGTYFGKVTVSAAGASNSPQTAVVVLNVLKAGSNPGPDLRPTGLVFTGAAGAGSPGSQDVTVANITVTPVTFGSSVAYVGADKGWIKYLPTDFTVLPNNPLRLIVQPDFTNLSAGSHRGALTLAFDDGSIQNISVLAVVAPAGTPGGEAFVEGDRMITSSCATKFLPQFTQTGFGSLATIGFPANITVKVVDDCGGTMTDGSVVVSFSNGDLPLSLVSLQDGNWTASWQPNHPASTLTLSVEARLLARNLIGTAQSSPVSLQAASQNLPVLSGGPVSVGTLSEGAFAPGDLILIKGTSLADGPATSKLSPLDQQLAGASVIIGGKTASLLYADSGQVIGLVPQDIPLNSSQQVIVQRNNLIGLAVPVIIAAAHPAILTKDGSGQGQGMIYKANGSLADTANPVKAGDTVVVYCTGLGAADANGNTTNRPTLLIGEKAAQVSYAGVALPQSYPAGGAPTLLGLVSAALGGLYQITAVVPAGVPNGPTPVTITSAGQTSQASVTLAISGATGNAPTIASINTAYGSADISQNDFIEIKGANLAAAIAGPSPLSTQLGGVTVSVNGRPALLYYVSPVQINALTPLDSTIGPVSVVVASNGATSASFTANLRTVTPTFLRFGASHITATHADGSLLGPASLGTAFTPAQPGETIVTYAVGFGLPSTALVNGSANQSGPLPVLPVCQVSGNAATVAFAGLNGFAGLYQLNLTIPTNVANGDNPVACTYGGQATPAGTLLTVQR